MNERVLNDRNRLNELIYESRDIKGFLDYFYVLTTDCIRVVSTDATVADIIDKKMMHEITTVRDSNVSLYFGKTMRDLKCVISDDKRREHDMWLRYVGPKMIRISNVNLPHSPIQGCTYKSLEEVIKAFMKQVDELSNYFDQMDLISTNCIVMEPLKPTYKEDYRKIYIADKIWLHVEVSPNGTVKNLNLINPFQQYNETLQKLLLICGSNMDIATNVKKVMDSISKEMPTVGPKVTGKAIKVPHCLICHSVELLGDNRVPLPLCTCEAYYHRSCLFEWFVICRGVGAPSFGVVMGSCPSCNKPIRCSEKDN